MVKGKLAPRAFCTTVDGVVPELPRALNGITAASSDRGLLDGKTARLN
jgi:hypothetical protein